MKPLLMFLLFGIFLSNTVSAQIKIGDNPQNIDASSVLELESTSRVLVITRINTTEMNAIVPQHGAMVYNTDTQCIHYYDGGSWVNLCENSGAIANLTTDPLVNTASTLVITPNGGNNHIEVAPNSIRSEQIIDGGINGIDIQDNSIGQNKLGNDAVGQDEILDNAVGTAALNLANIDLDDFTNNTGFITGADIVSSDANNSITDNSGAFYDSTPVLNTIALKEDTANKSDDIALGNSPTLFPTQNAVKTYVDNALGGSSQTIVSANTPNSIVAGTDGGALFDVTPLLNNITTVTANLASHTTIDGDLNDQNELTDLNFNVGTNILSLTNSATGPGGAVDLSSLAGGGGTYTAGNGLTLTGGSIFSVNDLAGEVTGPTTATVIANNAVTSTKIFDGTIAAADLSDMGATTTGQILKWNNTTTAWEIGTDLAGSGSVTDTDANDGLTDFNSTSGYNVKVDDTTVELVGDNLQIKDGGVTSAKIFDGAIALADLSDMGATTDGQVLKWNNTTTAWEIGTDLAGSGSVTDTDLNDGLTDFNSTTGYNVNVDDTTVELIGDNLQIKDGGVTSAKIFDGAIALADLSDMGATTDGQVLKWNNATSVWEIGADATGSAVTDTDPNDGLTDFNSTTGYNVKVDDTTVELVGDNLQIKDGGVTSTKIFDGTIALADLSDMGATTTGQVLKWNNATSVWEIGASHTGTVNSIFFANTDGTPTTADENAYDDNNGGLFWDPVQRYDSGALHIGLKRSVPGKPDSFAGDYPSKVVIAEKVPGSFAISYPLELRNEVSDANNLDHSSVGLLFSAEEVGSHGKGGLVYERKDNWGVGDFHFLQNSNFDGDNPSFADAVMTITNDGDVGIGTTTPDYKLDVNGQIKASNGFASTEGTVGNPGYGFFTNGDTDTGMYRIAADQLGFTTGGTKAMEISSAQDVGIGISPLAKLHVNGDIRAEGAITASGTITGGIPDYVFQKYFLGNSILNDSYDFLNLNEIELFLRKNHHLPGIQSAKEIKNQGFWDIGEASRINLEKIEELFLHTIEQEKKIIKLKSENESLSNELETLKKDVEEIKALLKNN